MISGTFSIDEADYDAVCRVYEHLKMAYDTEPDEVKDLCRELESFETFVGQLIINATVQYLTQVLSRGNLTDEGI